jgi:hypothetical protein
MVRSFVCVLVALVMVAGLALAQDKDTKKRKKRRLKARPTAGKFVSFKDAKLTITVMRRKKRGEKPAPEEKTFDVPAATRVIVIIDGKKTEMKSPDGLKDAKPGTQTAVFVAKDKKVVAVRLGRGKGKAKPRKDKGRKTKKTDG